MRTLKPKKYNNLKNDSCPNTSRYEEKFHECSLKLDPYHNLNEINVVDQNENR